MIDRHPVAVLEKNGDEVMTDHLTRVSEIAARWWADRLKRGDRKKFVAILAPLIEKALHENGQCLTECDYDPHGHLLTAIRAAVDPECRGFGFSADGILPRKQELMIYPDRMEPKDGYANWLDPIRFDARS